MCDQKNCSLYGIDEENVKLMQQKRKEVITTISDLTPAKQQQVINRLDELIKITLYACRNY